MYLICLIFFLIKHQLYRNSEGQQGENIWTWGIPLNFFVGTENKKYKQWATKYYTKNNKYKQWATEYYIGPDRKNNGRSD
jgi:hypothetical protein